MTEVAFHFNMPDKTRYLCRLLRKAVSQGAQVAVTGPDAAMDELDALRAGGRMVGVISHVAGLQERIRTGIRVEPSEHGSTARVDRIV